MIEKGKDSIIVPVVGQGYLGKHNEKLTVTSVGDHAYGRRGWSVGYTIIGPKFAQHMMELQRFMDWAKDDPEAKPRHVTDKRPIEFNPFAEARTTPCNRLGEHGCSRTGWEIDGKFCCDTHYIVAERRA